MISPPKGDVAIFWDFEGCGIPVVDKHNSNALVMAKGIRRTANRYGNVVCMKMYTKRSPQVSEAVDRQYGTLSVSGFEIARDAGYGEQMGMQAVMQLDIVFHLGDNRRTKTVVLITDKLEFTPLLKALALRKLTVVVVAPKAKKKEAKFESFVKVIWPEDVREAGLKPELAHAYQLPGGTNSERPLKTKKTAAVQKPSPEVIEISSDSEEDCVIDLVTDSESSCEAMDAVESTRPEGDDNADLGGLTWYFDPPNGVREKEDGDGGGNEGGVDGQGDGDGARVPTAAPTTDEESQSSKSEGSNRDDADDEARSNPTPDCADHGGQDHENTEPILATALKHDHPGDLIGEEGNGDGSRSDDPCEESDTQHSDSGEEEEEEKNKPGLAIAKVNSREPSATSSSGREDEENETQNPTGTLVLESSGSEDSDSEEETDDGESGSDEDGSNSESSESESEDQSLPPPISSVNKPNNAIPVGVKAIKLRMAVRAGPSSSSSSSGSGSSESKSDSEVAQIPRKRSPAAKTAVPERSGEASSSSSSDSEESDSGFEIVPTQKRKTSPVRLRAPAPVKRTKVSH